MIAQCRFQFAHGFAFITDGFGGPGRGLSQGYLALVIPDPNGNGGRKANDLSKSATGSGEFFPTLSANDGKLAFISDAQSPGAENLYVLNQFSYSILVGLNNTQQFVNVSQSDPTQGGILSVTLRAPSGQTTAPTEAQSAALTASNRLINRNDIGQGTRLQRLRI